MDTASGHLNLDPGVKKSPFDDLNKEELIAKCKGLLVIAQKAKLAKTELQSEIESYKLQLEQCESEKNQSQENNKTLQEIVESLTEQKLKFITEVDSAHSKIKALNVQCQNYEQEINKYKADLIIRDQNIADVSQKLSDLDSELISLKRQNKRLMEENDQLINQLTEIEARTAEFNDIGLEQREQLKLLEKSVLNDTEYKANIETLTKTIEELKDQLKTTLEEKSQQNREFEEKINELTQLFESEKNKKEKVNIKLRSYKDKILKCAACINQLKNSRYILTKTVKEYSDNIPIWQNDLIKATKVFDDQMNVLKNENISLNEKNIKLEDKLRQIKITEKNNSDQCNNTKVQELKNEKIELETRISKLQKQFDDSSSFNEQIQKELNEVQNKYKDISETVLPSHIAENKSLKEQINDNTTKLNSLTQNNKALNQSIEELNIENEKLKKSLQNNDAIESLMFQIKALESEKSTLVKEKLNAKDNVLELENINKGLTNQVTHMNTEIQNLKAELESLHKEKNVLESKHKTENEGEYNMLKCEIMELQEQLNLMKKEYDDMQDMNNLLKEEVDTLKFSLEQPKDDSEHSDLNVSLQTDIVKLETKLAAYKQENSSLLTEMKESRHKIKEYDSLVSEYEDSKAKLMSYKNENAELLHEMKEINQVLKERGESISKQQKAISEMERLIETLEKDRNSLNEEKNTLLKKIENLENDVKNAEKKTSENCELIDQILLERDNAQKEIAENESLIASLKDDIEKLKQTPTSVAVDLPNEDMSTSTISKAEEISRMKDLDETFEEKYTKLRIFALKLKKKLNETTVLLQNTEQDKAKLEKLLTENENKTTICDGQAIQDENKTNENNHLEVTELKDKIESLRQVSEEISNELVQVKAELNTKNQELAAEKEAHKVTKENLEKARRDVKKKNVLSLEIEDYERSLKELTTKMEEKKKKMVQMESTIDTQEGTITAMKTQIKLLEEQIKTEETQNRLTKEELQHIIEEGKDKDSVIQAKNGIISQLEQYLEDEKRKNEEADLEMTALMSDKEKVIMKLGEDKAELNNKVKKLEFKCAELNEKLKIVNMELADLKTEYTSYKVRAQAVLRQNQTVDHSQEEQLKEEAAALRAQIESLTLRLSTAQEQCSEQSAEAENARRRASEASSEVSRAQQRTARLHADLTRLSQQLDMERTQHTLQITTLTQCYKTQISDLESKLQKETELLRKQLAMAVENTKAGKAASLLDDTNQNPYMLPVIPKDDSDGEMDINVSLIPREEGEGSESAPSPPPSKPYLTSAGSGRSPVSLERLLEEGVPEDESLDTSSLALTTEQEIADLKRRLTAQQQRVKHVTVLLSESERECARMAQLSELLKVELRRVRGTSHNAHNAEYMKNVTLKFLTLPPGDERSRLVPVLQKILTLTNDETHKIHAIAKGQDPNTKGWGSYLPWPGGSK